MFKIRNIANIFCFFGVIYATNAITLLNPGLSRAVAEAELAAIKPHEALPLVLFQAKEDLKFPEGMVKAEILHGRMVKGTLFSSKILEQQIFFCPKSDSDELCLIPVKFKESQILQCTKEPTPIIKAIKNANPCGLEKKGIPHNLFYSICSKKEANLLHRANECASNDCLPEEEVAENEPYQYTVDELPFYTLCYNTNESETMFISYIIPAAELLRSNLLIRERSVIYPIMANDEIKPSNTEAIQEAIAAETASSTDKNKENSALYKVQPLIPHEDMAFALWRKTTYQYFNFDFQHKILIPLWNKINDKILSNAIRIYHQEIVTFVNVGVFRTSSTSKSVHDDQKFNIWIKIVYNTPIKNQNQNRGIAILMNNFLDGPTPTEANDSTSSNQSNEEIEKFCTNNLCIESLQDEFKAVGGRVRCCPVNDEVAKKFGYVITGPITPELYIPGITAEEVDSSTST